MAQTVCVIITAEERALLAAIVGDRSRPLKHVQRARIVLHSADRLPVLEVARRVSISRPAVWRWQRRYAEEGVDGLLHDKTRPAGTAPVPMTTVAKVLALTSAEPPGETTHWTGRAMAAAVGLSLRTIQRIWEAHRLQPHRLRTFKRSKDPAFAEKVEDIVGLYMRPPAHAIVLSIDEKSQIQALDRTQPGLPLKPGKCGTMTHDYKRHGTTTLFAAFNVLDGAVLGRCMQKHTHQEFIRFLNAVERSVPAGKLIHAILDNYATHKHPKVQAWLIRHPLDLPFHPDLQLLAQRRREFLLSSDPQSACGAGSSAPSSTFKPPSTATSMSTTATQSLSCGPSPRAKSSPSSSDCLYLPSESVH